MKFNWGTGIALVYATFAISMVTLVIMSTRHDPGLVSKDYYQLDIDYQDRMTRKQNTVDLALRPEIQYADKQIQIKFPEGMSASGKVWAYRSATVKDDIRMEISNESEVLIPTAKLAPGLWHVEITWTDAAGKPYFMDSVVSVTNA